MDWKIACSILLISVVSFTGCRGDGENSVDSQDWWQSAVLYQIYPRSFMDSNGDGVGDLRGIISRLSHLSDSGIKATWLSPIFESPMADFGYDISNFTAIQGEYGTMEDFEDLLVEAKKLGIKIILDFVPNHSSDKCEWFIKSVRREEGYEDFYVWADGVKDADGNRRPPNNWVSVFYGPAWTWNEERQQYYLHQFVAGQPDLNYRNPKVVEAMDEVLKFWLDKGVDGFRVDAVPHMFEVEDLRDEPETGTDPDPMSYGFLHHYYTAHQPETYEMVYHWRELLDDYKQQHGGDTRIMLTEAYANITKTMDYYESADGRKGSQVPFNFLLISDLNENSDARDFVFNIQKWLMYMPLDGTANWVMGNHDNPRVGSRYGRERIDAMNVLLMTLPGIAVTYNGEEIGMLDYRDISWEDTVDPAACNTNPEVYKKFSRDPERTPFQWDDTKNAGFSTADKTWLPLHPDYEQLNLAEQLQQDRSHYKLYQRLAMLRKLPTLRRGSFHPLALNRRVLAFKRELKGHYTLVTVINLSSVEDTVDLSVLGEMPEKLFVLAAGSESEYREGIIVDAKKLHLGSFDSLVLRGHSIDFRERRELVKVILKYSNVVLVGLLVYKLWNNKWTKLSFYNG